MQLKDYKIVSDGTIEGLVKTVNDLIRQGWVVVGGMAIETHPSFHPIYYQTLIMEY